MHPAGALRTVRCWDRPQHPCDPTLDMQFAKWVSMEVLLTDIETVFVTVVKTESLMLYIKM